MKDLQIFKNEEFGTIRTVTVDNEPWFVGKDVCEAFGDTNYRRSLATLDEDEKGVSQMDTPGGSQNMTIINESGLYTLMFNMQPQKAKGVSQNEQPINDRIAKLKRFKQWVTREVLPSIRKTGGYIAGQESLSDDELLTKALLVAQRKIEERNKLIETMKPKAIFADAVATSKTSILIGELAKLLKQNNIEIGQKRLFTWLRDNGYLMKRGSDYNMPTQRAMELNLFEIKETTINNPDGSIRITKTPKVTGKGQQYFINKFLCAEPL